MEREGRSLLVAPCRAGSSPCRGSLCPRRSSSRTGKGPSSLLAPKELRRLNVVFYLAHLPILVYAFIFLIVNMG